MKATKESCSLLRNDLTQAFKGIEGSRGITLQVGSMRYDPQMGTISVTLTAQCDTADGKDGAVKSWELGVAASGGRLTQDMFGSTLAMKGVTYRIVGFDHKRPKNCIQLRREVDGKGFSTSIDGLRRALHLPVKNEWPFNATPADPACDGYGGLP